MLQMLRFHCTQLLGLFLLLVQASLLAMPAYSADMTVDGLLENHAGSKRPVLIFGADIDDKAVAQIGALWSKRPELVERDMLIVRVQPRQVVVQRTGRHGDGSNKDVQTYEDPALAKAFRARYKVEDDDFTVVLIGKDGTEKGRSDQVLKAADIFELIDSMSMRQQEISQEAGSANGS
ncbi:MAG: hypothetical protein CME36_04385 [unclassified Hahellaceae]|nr:hypothetical protein [Hahellaceae bacterium]|tara:strand:+ start:102763 stop:103296 length:534 start_codon:yes stop_codon:yes gene_type:complete